MAFGTKGRRNQHRKVKFHSEHTFLSQSIVISHYVTRSVVPPFLLKQANHSQNQAFITMASGTDPPDALDKDNPTSARADLSALARARIDEARSLPREPPSGLLTTVGSTPSASRSSGNDLLDFSLDSLDDPVEVTIDSSTSSTIRHESTVEVGDATTVGNSGTITVISEEDTTLKPKFSSPPKEMKTVSFTDKKN